MLLKSINNTMKVTVGIAVILYFIFIYLYFREKSLTPLDVAKRVISAIKRSNRSTGNQPNMRMITEYYEDQILKVVFFYSSIKLNL